LSALCKNFLRHYSGGGEVGT